MIALPHKADVEITGVFEGWLAGRMKGAMRLEGEDGGEEREAAPGAMGDGQKIGVFFAKEYRMNRNSSVTEGFCYYVHTGTFGRVAKEKARAKEGMEARIIGKRPTEEGSGGTGGKKQKNG